MISWSPNAYLLKTASKLSVRVPLGGLLPKNYYKLTTKIQDDDLIVFFTQISSPPIADVSVESTTQRLRQEDGRNPARKDRELSWREDNKNNW